jgi:hypothetical protein
VYYVVLTLPDGTSAEVKVLEVPGLDTGDVLIGMDVIGVGDFAVSNYEDKTQFTFRHPSKEPISFS